MIRSKSLSAGATAVVVLSLLSCGAPTERSNNQYRDPNDAARRRLKQQREHEDIEKRTRENYDARLVELERNLEDVLEEKQNLDRKWRYMLWCTVDKKMEVSAKMVDAIKDPSRIVLKDLGDRRVEILYSDLNNSSKSNAKEQLAILTRIRSAEKEASELAKHTEEFRATGLDELRKAELDKLQKPSEMLAAKEAKSAKDRARAQQRRNAEEFADSNTILIPNEDDSDMTRDVIAVANARKIALAIFADDLERVYFSRGRMNVVVRDTDGSLRGKVGLLEQQMQQLIKSTSGVSMRCHIILQ